MMSLFLRKSPITRCFPSTNIVFFFFSTSAFCSLQSSEPGRFFGVQERFTGLAIIVNTNRSLLSRARPGEPTGRHRDVSIVANNGTREYGDLIAGLEGCTANVRFDERRDDFNVLQVGGWVGGGMRGRMRGRMRGWACGRVDG